MRYDLGRFRRPMRRSTEGQLMSLISLGDGSTLTLDFTTGVLDPRLTFTRASNATFINSGGLVQYAAVNEFRNTGWVTSTTPTGWNVTFGTGTTTWNNDGTLTMNTGGSSTRPCINANSFTVSQGIPYTFGYRVVSASGSPQIGSVISSTVAGETFAINGATVGGTTVVQAGDVVSCTFTPTTTSAVPRMGPGVNFGMTNTVMTITQPQMNPGVTLQAYRANSSTTAANNDSARFDHDPTTLAPRGLLIEGSATSLITHSKCDSNWGSSNYTASNNNATAPDGTTAATLWTGTGVAVARARSSTFSTTSGTTYTISAWVKKPASNGSQYCKIHVVTGVEGNAGWGLSVFDLNAGTVVLGTNLTATQFSNGWWRLVATSSVTHTGSSLMQILPCNSVGADITTTEALLWWGAQVETSSGASSYIPTGASTVTRNADECSMTGTSFSSWFTNSAEGSFYARYSMNNPAAFLGAGVDRYAFEVSNSSGTSRVFTNASYRVSTAGDAGRFPRVFDLGTIDLAPSLVATAAQNTALAWGYKANDNYLSAFGVTANDTSGTLQTGLDRIHLGASRTFGSTTFLNGCITQLKYWPTRLPNATLQSLTT